MKSIKIIALVLELAALAVIAVCIFTDWNDELYLPLGLCLSLIGNILCILSVRWDKSERERRI